MRSRMFACVRPVISQARWQYLRAPNAPDKLVAEPPPLSCVPPIIVPMLLAYMCTVSAWPGQPERALRPAGSPRRAPSAYFTHPSSSLRRRARAKQAWLFSRIVLEAESSVCNQTGYSKTAVLAVLPTQLEFQFFTQQETKWILFLNPLSWFESKQCMKFSPY